MKAMGAIARSIGDGGRLCALCLSAVLLLTTTTVQAQDAAAPNLVESKMTDQDEEARALYKAGVIAFDGGRFRNALDAFQRAYELSQRPELLYNVGSVADRLRLDAVALDAFERYLTAVPESPHAASVRARIEVLHQTVEAQREAQLEQTPLEEVDDGLQEKEEEPEPMAEPEPPPVEKPSWPKWTLIGAGGGAIAAGVAVLAIGQSHRSKLEGADMGTPYSDVAKYDNADALTGAGAAIAGIGVAAAVAGVVWLVMDGKGERQVAVGLTPGGLRIGGTL